ncbi:putative bNR/Asp-box repeat protein [Burkholderia sp. MSHR3999]|nr:putative bNR/Asp-box repeat protein [Burkholderia sp. MSHR3999]
MLACSAATSSGGGATWSVPLQVNTPTGHAAFNPSVQVDDAHAVMVTYYDFCDLPAGDTTTPPTDFWRKISLDGGATERRVGGRST